MYMFLSFQDINDESKYIEIVYDTDMVYGIPTLLLI